MFGLWDENTPGCAGICHSLTLWGAGEVIALAALLVTIVGVILALRSLRATQNSTASAAESARLLLEHEQSADLQIPYRAVEETDEIPEGAYLWISSDDVAAGTWSIRGRLLNAGRYDAREVTIKTSVDGSDLPSNYGPPIQPYIPAGGGVVRFEFRMPKDDQATERLGPRPPVKVEVDFADANVRDPSTHKRTTWLFEFPNRDLRIGDLAHLLGTVTELITNPVAKPPEQ